MAKPQVFWVAAVIATALIYYLSLQFIFPGYFAPIAPFHPDFYDYASTAYKSFQQLILQFPRPVAYVSMRIMSADGVPGLLTAEIALALANILLTVVFVRRYLQLDGPQSIFAFVIYALLLIAHPQFYFEHRHDLPLEVSYLFLLLALLSWMSWTRSVRFSSLILALVSAVLFAFAKETFFVGAPLLVAGLAIWDQRMRWSHLVFAVYLSACEVASLLWTRHFGALFVNSGADRKSDYYVSTAPSDILSTYSYYLGHLLTPTLVILVLWGFWAARKNGSRLAGEVVLVCAAILAVAPHALLPNHEFPQYAWPAAPLLLAPVLALVEGISSTRRIVIASGCLAVIAGLTIFGPFGYQAEYSSTVLTWMVRQDQYGRKVLDSLDRLRQIRKPARILVAGLEEPPVPWLMPDYVQGFFGDRMHWTVLYPHEITNRPSGSTSSFAEPAGVSWQSFDYVAQFDPSGRLIQIKAAREIDPATPREEVTVPALAQIDAAIRNNPNDGVPYIRCAAAAITWALWSNANDCLQRAVQHGFPSNDFTYIRLSAATRKGLAEPTHAAELLAEPPGLQDVNAKGFGHVTLSWRIPPGSAVEVHVGAPDGPLFAAGAVSGSSRTENWVRHGMVFYLQDVHGGYPLTREHTLATTKID